MTTTEPYAVFAEATNAFEDSDADSDSVDSRLMMAQCELCSNEQKRRVRSYATRSLRFSSSRMGWSRC